MSVEQFISIHVVYIIIVCAAAVMHAKLLLQFELIYEIFNEISFVARSASNTHTQTHPNRTPYNWCLESFSVYLIGHRWNYSSTLGFDGSFRNITEKLEQTLFKDNSTQIS